MIKYYTTSEINDLISAARRFMAKYENYFEEYGAEHLSGCSEDENCQCPLVCELDQSFKDLRTLMERE